MGFGSDLLQESYCLKWWYSTENYNEKRNDYINVIEKKIVS